LRVAALKKAISVILLGLNKLAVKKVTKKNTSAKNILWIISQLLFQ